VVGAVVVSAAVAGVLEVLVAAQPGAAAPEEAGECLATEAI